MSKYCYLDYLVELDTALLAKECGSPQFKDIDVNDYHQIQTWDKLRNDKWEVGVGEAAVESMVALTQSQLHTWIRQTHDLVIEVGQLEGLYYFMASHTSDHAVFIDDKEYYDSFEEAFERGLFATLEHIKAN